MTWGWTARGALPVDSSGTGTTAGGSRGGLHDMGTHAWPRYEAEYLKRALTSERYKYDTEGLDPEQKQVYLEEVTKHYKEEADEALKAEFDQWLQGLHPANDGPQLYENKDGKPVRRWTSRTKDAEDPTGASKVGSARAGWQHTDWGRASLTGVAGVREYLVAQKRKAHEDDLKLQLLADYGPQNLQEAWMYFKHWVKGRPVSDTVALPARFDHVAPGARSDFGNTMPQRMQEYTPLENDRQPEVYADDRNAHNAAVALPGEPPVRTTTDAEDRYVIEARQFREMLEGDTAGHKGQIEQIQREEAAELKDEADELAEAVEDTLELGEQANRRESLTAPTVTLVPALK